LTNLVWKVGDVTITRITESEWDVPVEGAEHRFWPDATAEEIGAVRWLKPHFVTPTGDLRLSFHSLLVETSEMRVVVDTCVGNDKKRHLANWNQMHNDYLEKLAAVGWTRETVSGVLCTHLHVDHVGWNTMWVDGRWVPTFPNARYYFDRREYEFWAKEVRRYGEQLPGRADESLDTSEVMADSVQPVVDAGLVQLVDSDARIAPEIRLIPTPGHSPGHVSIVVESKGERAVITGDVAHHPMQIAYPKWSCVFDSDPDRARETRFKFFEQFADTPTLVIGTHFAAPTAGRLVRDSGAYRFDV
jgi:glyoxylase-like metal-dependent hydrolase (beta-lactamase superfamily II)